MTKKKVLITGGSGLLGINWGIAIKDNYDVILGLHSKVVIIEGIKTIKLPLDNLSNLQKVINEISPDIIIHAAGMTNVDQCEKDPSMAEHLNSQLSTNISTICNNKSIRLIHISTDHLYDGNKANVTEKELTCPINVYGRSKLQGEKSVSNIYSDALIVRTNFFGWGGPYKQSFSDWVINSLRENKKIKLFDDVFYTPILIDRLAYIAMDLIEKEIKGVVNIVGDERVSKYEFANEIAKQFNFPMNLLEREKIENVKFLTQRPKDMSLSNKYVRYLIDENIGTIAQYISELKSQEEAGRAKLVKHAFV